jgi:hypothetical protein
MGILTADKLTFVVTPLTGPLAVSESIGWSFGSKTLIFTLQTLEEGDPVVYLRIDLSNLVTDFDSLDVNASFQFIHPDATKSRGVTERLRLSDGIPARIASGIDLAELSGFAVAGKLTVHIQIESIANDPWRGRSWE